MTDLSVDLPDEAATRRAGARLAKLLEPGDVVALYGNLGAGKTTLSRGVIQALCGDGVEAPSPTYTLVQTYEAPHLSIWHFDLYRLERPDEVYELGWDDAASGVALVEWPERAGALLPRWRLDLRLGEAGDGRRMVLEPHGEPWQRRIDGFRS
ncbi:MAG: tRNA (adenosine(37)-N6)-threonylcarbamoyltransferase complex ATPase subunit type 1 TsaE [Pseudomonadota bacterium]